MLLRRLLAVVGSVIAAVAVIYLTQSVGHALYVPVGVSATPATMADMVGRLPTGAKLVVVFGWFAGTAIGAALTLRLSGWRAGAWLVGALLAAAGLVTVLQMPHPLWMTIAAVVAPLLGVVAAGPVARWSARRAAERL